MRWLITGAGGQLASYLAVTLQGEDAVFMGRAGLDITSGRAVDQALRELRPDVVVNTAAWTAVDDAEASEDLAYSVNAAGPGHLAVALSRVGGRLVHVSTDYVFNGSADRPYEPDDPTDPRSAYGRTKLAGERAVLTALPNASTVVRTAWIYGGPTPNFVDTMLRLESDRDFVEVVTDQRGSPTYAADLAKAIVQVGSQPRGFGVVHYVNSGVASWFDVAQEVFRLVGADPTRVRPTDSRSYVRPAPRPRWSVLSTRSWTSAGFTAPRDWRDALRDYLETHDRR